MRHIERKMITKKGHRVVLRTTNTSDESGKTTINYNYNQSWTLNKLHGSVLTC